MANLLDVLTVMTGNGIPDRYEVHASLRGIRDRHLAARWQYEEDACVAGSLGVSEAS